MKGSIYMKTTIIVTTAAVLAFLGTASPVRSEEMNSRSMKVAFSNPDRPGMLKVTGGQGDLTVTGYDGADIEIVVIAADKEDQPVEDEKAKGMKRITGSSYNVEKDAETNTVTITRARNNSMDLRIRVPRRTSLNIGGSGIFNPGGLSIGEQMIMKFYTPEIKLPFGFYEGSITVESISGDIEINTTQGDIILRDVSGGVTANVVDGTITSIFRTIPATTSGTSRENPIALSTTDGDIDVTFPSTIKATITARNVDGDIYTDYDMDIVATVQDDRSAKADGRNTGNNSVRPSVSPRRTKTDGRNTGNNGIFGALSMFGNTVTGNINGGGADIRLTAFDGNIYIRKAK